MAELGVTSESEILSYYEGFDEGSRLGRGKGLLEFARKLIRRFLPSPPGVVLDVGGHLVGREWV